MDDDFTELRDADIDSVHAVGKAANGTRILFAKQQADAAGAGLFRADFVRDMIAKADLSAADLNDLPDSAFAYVEPGGSKDDDGKTVPRSNRHFAIHDAAHVRNALARASSSPFGDKAMPRIRAAAEELGVKVAKADSGTDPGSPGWEAGDATSGQAAMAAATQLHDQIKALMAREATEVGAGHLDDIADVLDLSGAADALECVVSTLAAFAAREQLEAGAGIAKAGQPDGNQAVAHQAVHTTMSSLAQACGCPACTGFLAAAATHDAATPTPPADATDGPAATTPGTPPTDPMEKAMTDAVGTDTTQTTPATTGAKKQSKKDAKRLAKSAANEAVAEQLAPITALLTQQGAAIEQLAKAVEAVSAQPVPTGVMMNGAVPGTDPAPVYRGGTATAGTDRESAELAQMRKAAAEETDPRRKKDLSQQALLKGLDEVFSQRPTVRP